MSAPTPLKEWFNATRYQQLAKELLELQRDFDAQHFLALTLPGLEACSLLQRLRRTTEALRATLPQPYPAALAVLHELAPRLQHNFVSLVLPDYVGLYGRDDFERSMAALKFFTPFGSSEFAVREFLRLDLRRTLKVMTTWADDPDEQVRRLASEGCRPRLPWSFRLAALMADPTPVASILDRLQSDPSLYVRKSVANHLNDITKDNPDWVFARLAGWDLTRPTTAWIAKQALRTLIKRGDRQALGIIGAGRRAEVAVTHFEVSPAELRIGETLTLSARLQSSTSQRQKLVVDYALHYVKQAGTRSAKVFKWKEVSLEPHAPLAITKRQCLRDFTTRRHHPGRHAVDLLVNGEVKARAEFMLEPPARPAATESGR
jgi:3-methyladenine DNA glycosylase AlkC